MGTCYHNSNLSDHNISEQEESVLKLGLNFSVSPDKVPFDDMVTAVESAVKLVGHNTAEADEIRNKTSHLLVETPKVTYM